MSTDHIRRPCPVCQREVSITKQGVPHRHACGVASIAAVGVPRHKAVHAECPICQREVTITKAGTAHRHHCVPMESPESAEAWRRGFQAGYRRGRSHGGMVSE